MPKVDGGFLIIARKMFEGELMDKPDLWVKLWLWMIFKANFKDHKKLKRGQLLTSIKEMQEAMSYKVGYRKQCPTVGQIRNSYEAFTNNNMISIAKTTRGMIITILNYDKYQSLNNYEQHGEQRNEKPTNSTTTTQDKGSQGKSGNINTGNASAKPGPCPEEDWEKYLAYSEGFLSKQEERWGKLITITDSRILSGARALDNLIRVQSFQKQTVHETIEWARNDDFWSLQLRSLGSLTKKGNNGETKFTNILAARAKEINDAQ